MARAVGANARLASKFETTYGTAATGDYALLPFISCDLGAEQPLEANDVLGLGREPAEPSRGVITDQGNVVVPLDLRDFGLWLKGLMGPPTTTGTTPAFVHVFTSGAASLPSLSLELGFPEVPRYFQNLGCLVGSIKFPWATSGRANATVALIGQGETNSATSVAGTPTTRSLRRFQQSMGFIRKDGAALGLVTAGEIDLFRRAGRPTNPGAGRHQARPGPGDPPPRIVTRHGKIEGCDLGVAACSGQISVRFADTTLLDAASAGTPIALSMGWTLSTDQALIIDLPAVYLPRAKRAISGPNGIEARYSFQAAKPASGPFVTITLKNDVETY